MVEFKGTSPILTVMPNMNAMIGAEQIAKRCHRTLKVFLLIGGVAAVIVSLNRLEDRLHLLGLAAPFFLTHLGLTTEQLLVGLAVTATKTVPERCELPVVVVEVQVMHGVASGSIYNWAVGNVLSVMDEHRPEVDKAEENDVGQFLQREDERKHMIRHTLRPAVEGVEGVGGVWARHNPLVVRLMKSLVDTWVVEAAVNPVNEEVREEDKQREL